MDINWLQLEFIKERSIDNQEKVGDVTILNWIRVCFENVLNNDL